MPSLQLYGSVGPDEENVAEDVASVGNSLVDLGLSDARDAARSGVWENRFDATVKSFQETNGLDVDGILLPGGPTQAAINSALEQRRSAVPDRYASPPSERSQILPRDAGQSNAGDIAAEKFALPANIATN